MASPNITRCHQPTYEQDCTGTCGKFRHILHIRTQHSHVQGHCQQRRPFAVCPIPTKSKRGNTAVLARISVHAEGTCQQVRHAADSSGIIHRTVHPTDDIPRCHHNDHIYRHINTQFAHTHHDNVYGSMVS